MTKYIFIPLLLLFSLVVSAQNFPGLPQRNSSNSPMGLGNNPKSTDTVSTTVSKVKAPYDFYRVISLERDTTYIDTSLTIKKLYLFNYLRKDIFGLLPFANEGQTYTTLQHGLNQATPFPEFGFEAKHFNYIQANEIKYYSVATPLSELYYKTVVKQGQSLDAFITLNTSEQLNFSIAYRGLRSLGRYVNQGTSAGNFRFTTSYNTKDKRYFLKAHLVNQDLKNYENGGIINTGDFESKDPAFSQRDRFQVYLTDAKSFLVGARTFVDHSFRLNAKEHDSNWFVSHQFNYENKYFEYSQNTLPTSITNPDGSITDVNRFGDSFLTSNLVDKAKYNRYYNKAGLNFENKTLGLFTFFVDDFRYKYHFDSVQNNSIPSSLNKNINTIGGQYKYQMNNWNGNFSYAKSMTQDHLSSLDMSLAYAFDEDNMVSFQVQKMNKLPNHNYNLYHSGYINYNWSNDFKNEKINNLKFDAETQWLNATVQYNVLNDKLYFGNDSSNPNQILMTPKQYGGTINYLSVKASREFTFGKFALDNTLLYQKVQQSAAILNLPEFVTRNSFYFSDDVFKKAMLLQTGVTFNYFTKYYANDYNPLMGEFYVQNQKQIGAFPMFDYFVNARIRQTRIYFIAEHFNAIWGERNYYTAPNYPYKDFIIRFGLVWTFFQ
ncbi:MAG: putative porin [Flavobacterium sp.]